MNTFQTFEEYLKWRQDALHMERKTADLKNSRRGKFWSLSPFTMTLLAGSLPKPVTSIKLLSKAEAMLWWDGLRPDSVLAHAYQDDKMLEREYGNLFLDRLENAPAHSRNNVICNHRCCVSFFQMFDRQLFAVSRSLDLDHAGVSDAYTIDTLAKWCKCWNWTWTVNVPHIYECDEIVRRAE